MSRLVHLTLATAVLALSVTASSAQIFPATNGPNGTAPNILDSARGFSGINAVAPEREFLYHPERAGNAAAELGVTATMTNGVSAGNTAPFHRHTRHRHQHSSLH